LKIIRLSTLVALATVTALAQTAAPAPDVSPFGIGSCHINGRSVEDFARWLPQMQELGVRYLRSPATYWGAVEPEEGKWTWTNLDAQLLYLEDRQIRTGALLLGNAGWNKADAAGHLPVNNLPGW
jgi:polysaccharide biosynthesis protein PslG